MLLLQHHIKVKMTTNELTPHWFSKNSTVLHEKKLALNLRIHRYADNRTFESCVGAFRFQYNI